MTNLLEEEYCMGWEEGYRDAIIQKKYQNLEHLYKLGGRDIEVAIICLSIPY